MVADYKEDPYQHIKAITVSREGVRFSGNVHLIATLNTTSSSRITFSHWIRLLDVPGPIVYWGTDPDDTIANVGLMNQVGQIGADYTEVPFPEEDGGRLQFGSNPVFDGAWHHVMHAVDTNFGGEDKIAQLAIDRIPQLAQPVLSLGNAFEIAQNGLPFIFGGFHDPPYPVFECYDLWIDFGTFLSPYSASVLDKFVIESFVPVPGDSGGGAVRVLTPADLGPRGELPMGERPTIFGRGNAETFLQPNLGIGGSFVLNGNLVTVPGP